MTYTSGKDISPMANHWMRLMDNVCFMVNDYRLLLERQSGGRNLIIESSLTALASLLVGTLRAASALIMVVVRTLHATPLPLLDCVNRSPLTAHRSPCSSPCRGIEGGLLLSYSQDGAGVRSRRCATSRSRAGLQAPSQDRYGSRA